ncbi:MAG: hypothetical protein WDM88_07105 [Galbitalea sp.]
MRDEFVALGLATERTVIRNLYGDLRAEPAGLRAAARSLGIASPAPAPAAQDLVEKVDLDAAGRPWRITASDRDGHVLHTDFLDAAGHRLLRLPFIAGRADWHRASVANRRVRRGGQRSSASFPDSAPSTAFGSTA